MTHTAAMAHLQPRGLRRVAAAAYLGISPSHFDKERARGSIPAPKMLFGVAIYDRNELDVLFDGRSMTAANDNDPNPWDVACSAIRSRAT